MDERQTTKPTFLGLALADSGFCPFSLASLAAISASVGTGLPSPTEIGQYHMCAFEIWMPSSHSC